MCVKIPKTGDEILPRALSGVTKETEPRRMKMIYNNHNIAVVLLETLQPLELMADRPRRYVNPLDPFPAERRKVKR